MVPKYINKLCRHHGTVEFVLEGRGIYRCKICRLESVKLRRERIKYLAVQHKGGRCEECGYDRYIGALEFHHLDPSQKDFSIGYKGYTRSWEIVKKEIEKCKLLCANCHREEHSKLPLNTGLNGGR